MIQGMSTRQFQYRWEWDLRSPPAVLWPLVADTDRFNRDAGLTTVERVGGDALANARRRLRFHRLGVTVEWEEEPFEWAEPHGFSVVRRYSKGPFASLHVRARLTPTDSGGTHLVYEVDATPRNLLGRASIPLQIGWLSARTFARVFHAYDRHASTAAEAGIPTPVPAGPVRFTRGGRRRLDNLRQTLLTEGVDATIVAPLADLVGTCDDLTAHQLRPYELADTWELPRDAVLEACLVATRLGLLEFEWHLLCPLCRGARARTPTLGGLEPVVHCDTCNIDFEVNFERSVELTFHPNPSIRHVVRGEYCIAGPRVTPHVVAQQLLAPGESRLVQLQLEPGHYRLRTLNQRGAQTLQATDTGPREVAVPIRAIGWPAGELQVGRAPRLHLLNKRGEEQLLIIERQALSDQAVTAAEVISLQRFRDLFASEALRPGERISVGSLAVAFTDLYGSTQLYRRMGDAAAFGVALSHFDIVRQTVIEHGGVVIKTMGDAIMATFRSPAQALAAMLAAQRLLADGDGDVAFLRLKAGIHYGPCIAVTLNDRLDYFGSTVNVAARLQDLSVGGDIIVSDAVCDDPEVAEFLLEQGAGLVVDHLQQSLRGFDGKTFSIARVAAADLLRA